jgi:hypothetical protein
MTVKRAWTISFAAATLLAVMPFAAYASLPMFNPRGPLPFIITGGPGTIETSSGEKIVCNSDLGHGNITGLQTFLALVIFHGCIGHSSGGSECAVHSPGQREGLIHVHTVGELGTIKAGKGAGNIGAIIEPALGGVFVTIVASCLTVEETAIEGVLAGEFPGSNRSQTTGKLVISGSAGKSGITEISVLHKVIKPKVEAFGLVESSLSHTTESTADGPIEIT